MELWEGAALVVGGLWLIGRMSRKSATAPVAVLASTAPASNSITAPMLQVLTPQGPAGEASNGQTQPVLSGEGFLPPPSSNIQVGGVIAVGKPLPKPVQTSYANLSTTGIRPPSYATSPYLIPRS